MINFLAEKQRAKKREGINQSSLSWHFLNQVPYFFNLGVCERDMAFHPAPACHVTPLPTTEIKTNCLERLETKRLEPRQTNSAVAGAGGRLGLNFGLSFPGRFCDFHFSFSCRTGGTFPIPALSRLGFGVASPGGISSPSQPRPIHLPIPGTPDAPVNLGKPNGNSPVPLPAPQRGCQPPGPGRALHQHGAGMVFLALPCQPWGGDAGTGVGGCLPGGCRARGAWVTGGPASAAGPTGVGRVLLAAPC